jgi:hypothetical protein
MKLQDRMPMLEDCVSVHEAGYAKGDEITIDHKDHGKVKVKVSNVKGNTIFYKCDEPKFMGSIGADKVVKDDVPDKPPKKEASKKEPDAKITATSTVTHKKFGRGIVVRKNTDSITVNFDNHGVKDVFPENLKLIDDTKKETEPAKSTTDADVLKKFPDIDYQIRNVAGKKSSTHTDEKEPFLQTSAGKETMEKLKALLNELRDRKDVKIELKSTTDQQYPAKEVIQYFMREELEWSKTVYKQFQYSVTSEDKPVASIHIGLEGISIHKY